MKNIVEEILSKGNDVTLTKEELCMYIATLASYRSKDPNTQVGACIVDKDYNVLSIGNNNPPRSWNNDKFPWGRDTEKLGIENTKYPYVIHAEANALNNYRGSKENLKDATIFVTLFPCSDCTKQIVESGIKRVVYKDDKYNNTKDNMCAKILLKYCKVEFVDIKEITHISDYDVDYKQKKKTK